MTARLLSARRWEDIDPVAALRELSRAAAALSSAVRELAGHTDTDTEPNQENPMSETSPTVTDTTRFERADITTLRHALLADADIHDTRAAAYSGASTGTEMAAWCGLLLAASHNRMAAALLGLLSDPRVPADLAERGRYLVGQVLAGWPEVLEGANDDLPDAPAPQIPGQVALPLTETKAACTAEVSDHTCTCPTDAPGGM